MGDWTPERHEEVKQRLKRMKQPGVKGHGWIWSDYSPLMALDSALSHIEVLEKENEQLRAMRGAAKPDEERG